MGRAVGVRVSGERSAVGAGHARPARVRQTGACGKAARRGQDPSLQDDDNGCFVGSGLDRSVPVRGGGNLPGRDEALPYRALINCVIVMILRILLKISSVYGKIRR